MRANGGSGGVKRAAIYIRVSSERQAEKASPDIQEADCLELCANRGWPVAEVYRDVEKYRVGQRMVEPSATRADRPGFRRMLADAKAGRFDAVVAWREDRLYRGVTSAVVEFVSAVEDRKLEVALVRETFDVKMAYIKASIGKIELDAKHDRMVMGMRGRFAAGKVWGPTLPYGYKANPDGTARIVPEEMAAVESIKRWYADGVPWAEIRRRLIASGAPQRNRRKDADTPAWAPSVLFVITFRETYHIGRMTINLGGEPFVIPLPAPLDGELWERIKARNAANKINPHRHVKHNYLAMGLIRCPGCGYKMRTRADPYKWTRADGTTGSGFTPKYQCNRADHREGCIGGSMGAKRFDALLWAKVWEAITNDAWFDAALEEALAGLRSNAVDADAETKRVSARLAVLDEERNTVVTWGRTKLISQDEMVRQKREIELEEARLRDELARLQLSGKGEAGKLADALRNYRRHVAAGMDWLNAKPGSPEMAQRQFDERRRIVADVVRRVDVNLPDRSPRVNFVFEPDIDSIPVSTPWRR